MGEALSAHELQALDEARALRPRGRYHELALDHVSFDLLVGAPSADTVLRRALHDEPAIITVIGGAGAGKSGTIAACTAALDDDYAAVRVPVAAIGARVTDPVALGQHIIRAVIREASSLLSRRQREVLELLGADRVIHAGGGLRVAGAAGIGSMLFSKQISAEVASARRDRETLANAVDVVVGLESLVSIVAEQGQRLVLIFEDTDRWRHSPPDVAGQFLAQLVPLARDIEVHVVIAIDERWKQRPGYGAARDRIGAEVVIPVLDRPAEAIRTILQRRIDRSAIDGANVDDVFTAEALVRLEAEYDHTGGNLRRVLALCDTALTQSGPRHPERLSEQHLRAAGTQASG
jgi:Cdc6-like AAA superfamily ATPase